MSDSTIDPGDDENLQDVPSIDLDKGDDTPEDHGWKPEGQTGDEDYRPGKKFEFAVADGAQIGLAEAIDQAAQACMEIGAQPTANPYAQTLQVVQALHAIINRVRPEMTWSDDKIVFHQNANGHWYWARIAPNGRSVAIGGEGYFNRRDCENMARHVNVNVRPEDFVEHSTRRATESEKERVLDSTQDD